MTLRWTMVGLVGGTAGAATAAGAMAWRLAATSTGAWTSRQAEAALLAAAVAGVGGVLVAFVVGGRMGRRIEGLVDAASAAAAGDLTRRVPAGGADEIGRLATSLQALSDGLRRALGDLRGVSGEVEREAGSIQQRVTQQASLATEQAAAMMETSTTATEIAQTAQVAMSRADAVIAGARASEELGAEGRRALEASIDGIRGLGTQVEAIADSVSDLAARTRKVREIVATVRDLADQSNLLAINASVEAARVGAEGRGFGVVAMELSGLAEQSKVAAGEVRAILGEIQQGTEAAVAAAAEGSRKAKAAVTLAEQGAVALDGLTRTIQESTGAARQIAHNTRQQGIGVEQIVTAIRELTVASADSAEGSREVERATQNLAALSRRLSSAAERYRG